jgi:hypothetical protein
MKKKIAYGASFGHENLIFTLFEKLKLQYFLSKFDAISVREQSGVKTLKGFHIDSCSVLDPIFLCSKKHFEDLISTVTVNSKSYVLNYILDPTEAKKNLIAHVSSKLNKSNINILDGIEYKYERNKELLNLDKTLPLLTLPQFLAYYKNSDFVITDSFHGTVCAILFRKPFISIANRHRGVTRFTSLLGFLNLKNRLLFNPLDGIDNDDLLTDIPYDNVEVILEKEKQKSYNWLYSALNKKKEIKKEGLIDIICKWFCKKQAENKFIFIEWMLYRLLTLLSIGDLKRRNKSCRNKLHAKLKSRRKV